MTHRRIVLGSLLVCIALAGVARASDDLDAWLAGRVAAARGRAGGSDVAPDVRADLAHARARLAERGYPRPVADALTTPPEIERRRLAPAEAAAVLESTRRRIERFESASREVVAAPRVDETRRTLEGILADPLFEANLNPRRSAAERWVRAARRFVYDLVSGALAAIASVPGLGEALAYTALGAAIVATGWLVVRWTRRPRPSRPSANVGALPRPDVDRSAEQLLARARRARTGMDAIRLAQGAAILALQRRGALPDRPGLTDMEGLAELREVDDGDRRRFERLCDLHDGVVYGGHASTRATVDAAIAFAEGIVEASA